MQAGDFIGAISRILGCSLIGLLATACAAQDNPTDNLLYLHNSTPTAVVESTSILNQECVSESYQVTDFSIKEFNWSPDSRFVYLLDESNVWWTYNIETDELLSVENSYNLQSTEITDNSIDKLLQLTGLKRELIVELSIAPSLQTAIFAVEQPSANLGVPAPSYELAPSIDLEFELFVWDINSDTISPLGPLPGVISEIIWTGSNNQALLVLDKFVWSPEIESYYWYVNIDKPELILLWPENNLDKAVEIWGYSPDFSKALIGWKGSNNLKIYDFKTHEIADTILEPSFKLWWLEDSDNILFIELTLELGEAKSYLRMYEISSNRIFSVSHLPFYPVYFRSNSIILSPDEEVLAYIEGDSYNLHIVKICVP